MDRDIQDWTTVIKAKNKWFDINLKELWDYRDLILLFVRRDFVAIYKQTILGPLWFVLQPLISTLIFTLIFGFVAKIPTDGVPPLLFYLSGIVVWNFFSSTVTKTADLFITNAGTFGKVYFPRLSVPIAIVMTNLLTFCIQLGLLVVIIGFYVYMGARFPLTFLAVLLPMIMLVIGILGVGFGIIISSVTTKYRDLSMLVTFGMQLWMYATPIIYPLSQIPEKYRVLYLINPMATWIEAIRYVFLGVGTVTMGMMFSSLAITIVVLILGLFLFSRIEKTFIDTI